MSFQRHILESKVTMRNLIYSHMPYGEARVNGFFFVLKSLGNVFLFKHITVSTAAPFHDLPKPKLLNTFR